MGPLPDLTDRRSTPRVLRVPGLLLLAAMAVYQLEAFRMANTDYADWPAWHREHPFATWPATWKMFTGRDRSNRDMYARVLRDNVWERTELHPLFPSMWESGPRYMRKPFWREAKNRHVLAQALCRRLDEPAEAVEVWMVDWRKTLGQVEQPMVNEESTLLVRWECADHQPLPTGRRL